MGGDYNITVYTHICNFISFFYILGIFLIAFLWFKKSSSQMLHHFIVRFILKLEQIGVIFWLEKTQKPIFITSCSYCYSTNVCLFFSSLLLLVVLVCLKVSNMDGILYNALLKSYNKGKLEYHLMFSL